MRRDSRLRLVLATAAALALAPALVVLVLVVGRGAPALWQLAAATGGLGLPKELAAAAAGTLWLVAGTAAAVLPLGVATAIHLSEYAPNRAGAAVRRSLELLAGVPSVVYGLFGMAVFVVWCGLGVSALAGSLTLALCSLPVVVRACEEALQRVPATYREASLALGVGRGQTVRRVILPTALPGILTAALLALGRAAGETAPILFTAAVFYTARPPASPLDPVMALPYHLYVSSSELVGSDPRQQWAAALLLLLLGFVPALPSLWRGPGRGGR